MYKGDMHSDYGMFTQETPFSFSKHSSIGCGGFARTVFYPKSVIELTALLRKLKSDGLDYYVLGNLTNVLPPDKDSDRVIVRTKNINGILFSREIFVYAGVTSGAFLQACKRNGKSGGEFLCGVPCSFGGALYMNAGADGRYIEEIVENVLVYRDGKTLVLPLSECAYSYKKSVFMENEDVILGASLRLQNATNGEIEEKRRYYTERRAHLPVGKSMGCVFKNPEGRSAGELIERSGLKGMRIGGAVVSDQHANFILNDRNATSADIKSLIKFIKNAVFAQYGILLKEEIRYLQ